MSTNPPIPLHTAQGNIDQAKAAGKSVYDAVKSTLNDPLKASQAASDVIAESISHSTVLKGTIDAFMALLNPLLTAFFASLSEVRKGVTNSMGATTAEVLNEFLQTDLVAADIQPGANTDATLAKCQKIGQAVLTSLEHKFTKAADGSSAIGEKAAQAFAGFGVNFAIQNAIITLIGGLLPEVHTDDIRELGVEVAQNLGLGRLVRRALTPLVQATIATPYTFQLQQRYRPNLVSQAEALAAWHANRVPQNDAHQWLEKHGFGDVSIAELIEQTRLRLNAEEWNTLTAIANWATPDTYIGPYNVSSPPTATIPPSQDPAAYDDQAKGMDDDWIALRQQELTWKRLAPLRDRVLSEVVTRIRIGFEDVTTLQKYLRKYQIPADEAQMWRDAAGLLAEVPRKRISQAEMLFLYETAQVTDDEVETWLKAEGFSDSDVQLMLTYFRLKLVQAGHATSAARAAALHKEHIAYVTDEITGLWSRPPTAQELNYWVNLLDSAQRTKHDFVTELKALPTTGAARP